MKKLIILIIILLLIFRLVDAGVKGPCSNCHTIHNSQNGTNIYEIPNFGPADIPRWGGPGAYLVKVKCISCHSSNDSSPTKMLGESIVPVVYNMVEPVKMTAGGNFYYVQNKGDGYGHNVITIDSALDHAPGYAETNVTCGFGGCHKSLANIRLGPGYDWYHRPVSGNGCIGCHVPKHHAPDPVDGITREANGCYRFLGKASWVWNVPPHSCRPCVEGIEDNDWELTVSENDHNEYRDVDKPGAYCYGSNPKGISEFCAGCHRDYHSWDNYAGGARNRSSDGSWLRHPAGDTEIPNRGEYMYYTTYNPQAPVSRPVVTSVSSTVTPGVDKVMCLSCHRAHGSPYPDMLRWDYNEMIAGDSSKSGGCFTCHTKKNTGN